MSLGLIGKKVGMTRVFTEAGISIPVTVVHAPANRITQVRTPEADGYHAVQVTYGDKKPSRINKPTTGQFAKSGVAAGRGLREFRLEKEVPDSLKVGTELSAALFSVGQKVSVAGTSKGKGFAGPVKRHNFAMQDATHGNSISHRAHGSTGQCQDPGRVFKGKKMAGQMGNVRVTTKNLEVVQIDTEKELLLIKGSVPGAPGGDVIVKPVIASEVNLPADEVPENDQPENDQVETAQDAVEENTES
jgi:large subunit ribosomal protein L3